MDKQDLEQQVEQLRDMSRIEALDLDSANVDVVVERIVQHQSSVLGHLLELDTTLDPDLGVIVDAMAAVFDNNTNLLIKLSRHIKLEKAILEAKYAAKH